MRTPAGVLVIVALMAGGALVAQAQDRRIYEQRSDSMLRVWRELVTASQAYNDSVARDTRRYHTVRAGPLGVEVAEPRHVPLATAALRDLHASLGPMYGRALDTLGAHRFIVRSETDRLRDDLILLAEVTPERGYEIASAVVYPDSAAVVGGLRVLMLQALGRSVDPTFIRWLRGSLPQDTARTSDWTAARVDLLSSQSSVGFRCYQGDIRACQLSLSLLPVSDTVMELFDAADRRRMVQNAPEWERRFTETATLEKCEAGVDSACAVVLRRPGGAGLPDPVPTTHRLAVVQLATSLGGRGAYERLLLTDGTPAQRISAAAKIPIDSVMRIWVARARNARLGSEAMSLGIAASSVVWVLAFGALAMRGSRWR